MSYRISKCTTAPGNDHKQIKVFKRMMLDDTEKTKVEKVTEPIHIGKDFYTLEKRKYIIIRPVDNGRRGIES